MIDKEYVDGIAYDVLSSKTIRSNHNNKKLDNFIFNSHSVRKLQLSKIATISNDGKSISVDIANLQSGKATAPQIEATIEKVALLTSAEASVIRKILDSFIAASAEKSQWKKEHPQNSNGSNYNKEGLLAKQVKYLLEKGFTQAEADNLKAVGFLGTDEAFQAINSLLKNVAGSADAIRAKLPAPVATAPAAPQSASI